MRKFNTKAQLLSLALSTMFLSGCGDNYPETGKLTSNSFFSKSIAKYSTVYVLDKSDFESWKQEQSALSQFESMSEEELLKHRKVFLQSKAVTNAFYSNVILTDPNFSIDKFVQEEFEHTKKKIDEGKTNLATLEKEVAILESRKKSVEEAKQKLRSLKATYEQKRRNLSSKYDFDKEQAANIFVRLFPNNITKYNSPKRRVLAGSPFKYREVSHKTTSCKQTVVNKAPSYKRKEYKDYLYFEPVIVEGEMYCPYFATMGNQTVRNSILKQLTDKDKKIIGKALISKLNKSKLTDVYRKKGYSVNKDNPEIYTLSNSWSWKNERELSSKTNLVNRETQKLNKLGIITKIDIRKDKLGHLTRSMVAARPYYLLEQLQPAIKKESNIQPDGTFTLKSAEDFYLIEFDTADKRRPKAIQYALIRMQQFKDKPQVDLSTDAFFAFKDLPSISL